MMKPVTRDAIFAWVPALLPGIQAARCSSGKRAGGLPKNTEIAGAVYRQVISEMYLPENFGHIEFNGDATSGQSCLKGPMTEVTDYLVEAYELVHAIDYRSLIKSGEIKLPPRLRKQFFTD